jgi:hypothetical protein
MMDPDTPRGMRKENMVETHGKEVYVPQNSKPVKYSVSECCRYFESERDMHFVRVCALVSHHHRRLGRPVSNINYNYLSRSIKRRGH